MRFKIVILLALICTSCGSEGDNGSKKTDIPSVVLASQSDSLSYVVGLSMAQNLMKVDSLLDLRVVAAAIAQYGHKQALFTTEDARSTYLKYLLHVEPERRRSYEDQYLREVLERDRTYARSRTGIIYNITRIGTESLTPRNNGDWVEVDYIISRAEGGEELYSTYKSGEPLSGGLSTLPKGIMECIKLIGKGGQITALIPSRYAYDGDGDEKLGIAPFETLRYDIELVNMERNAANKRIVARDPATF